jgi:hypothetical protein
MSAYYNEIDPFNLQADKHSVNAVDLFVASEPLSALSSPDEDRK